MRVRRNYIGASEQADVSKVNKPMFDDYINWFVTVVHTVNCDFRDDYDPKRLEASIHVDLFGFLS